MNLVIFKKAKRTENPSCRLFPTSYFLFPISCILLSGCFNEPTPANKTVPAENRVYLSDKGLKELVVSGDAFKAGAAIDYLNLDRNQFTNVDAVVSLTGLKWLRLNDNKLASLPSLASLKSLRRIYLKNNRLTAVPETLKDLPMLTDADLSGNPIKDVPDWFAAKTGLKNVSLSRTMVTKLPANLEAWKTLQSLQLGELKIPADEMARIRKALPNVAIVF